MTDYNVALHTLKHVYACEQDAPEKIAIIVHNYEQSFQRYSVDLPFCDITVSVITLKLYYDCVCWSLSALKLS